MSESVKQSPPFKDAAKTPQWLKNLKLPSLSDAQHLGRALGTDDPHGYIADRAGMLAYEGLRGIGFVNAVTLHKKIIAEQGFDPSLKETQSISLRAALVELKLVRPVERRFGHS